MYPRYLNLSKKKLANRAEKLFHILKKCQICPRKCQIDRTKKKTGFCQLGELPVISAFHPHFGEEAPLVGKFGSGTIFFTSCNLSCLYCQNFEISQLRIGKEVSFEELAKMMIALQSLGCLNINLVTPTPQVPQIVKSLLVAIELGLKIPLVYNTSSYDTVETLKLLDGIIDIYMPDTKYSDNEIAFKYSMVPCLPESSERKTKKVGYFEAMKEAIKEMHRQVGDLVLEKEGIARQGLLIRHLVLPNNLAGSEKIFQFLSEEISQNSFINIMDQYRPCHKATEFFELSRRISKEEFEKAIFLAQKYNLKRLYLQ